MSITQGLSTEGSAVRGAGVRKKAKTRTFWSGLAGLILSFATTVSHAYEFTSDFKAGHYWASFPITFTVSPAGITDSEREVTEQALIDAMDNWMARALSPVRPWEFIPWEQAQGQAGMQIVRWSDNFTKDTGYSALGTMAVTTRQASIPYFQRTEITINRTHSALQNQENLTAVLEHELGHTIGLDHTKDTGSVMYNSISFATGGNNSLSEDDQAGFDAVVAENVKRQKYGSALTQDDRNHGFLSGCAQSSALSLKAQYGDGRSFWLGIGELLLSLLSMMAVILMSGKMFTWWQEGKKNFRSTSVTAKRR